jgi:dienelactone hydrolase
MPDGPATALRRAVLSLAAALGIGAVVLAGCTTQEHDDASGAPAVSDRASDAPAPEPSVGAPGAAPSAGASAGAPSAGVPLPDASGSPTDPSSQPEATATTASPTAEAEASRPPAGPPPTSGPVRLERWFDRDLSGGRLRLGALREQTSAYRSYNVSYRSEDLRISGVINVPRGRGPFPAVVLAHGYIDPAVYVRGQGMPRERRALAEAGYIALHVDYRNHAASDDDPALERTFRLGYAVDVLNAVNALRATDAVPVDDDRIALMGRSMGGGVVYKALEMAPGLVDAAVVFAAVSSDEAENYRQFASPSSFWDYVERRWGTPRENPDFWAGVSPDGHFDRITEPVLILHGTVDTTCPPRWATRTARAMQRAGVTAILRWYEGEGHTFGPAFDRAMRRSLTFLEHRLD